MARYAAGTLATQVSDIDVVEVANRALASSFYASAFMPVTHTFRAATRNGILVQRGSKTWAAMDLDSSVGTEPDETAYNPTGRTFTCTGHGIDTVAGQYGLLDGNSSGDDVVNAIVAELAVGYAKYFDNKCANLYTEAPSSTPDHEIGSSSTALTGPLIDQGLELLLTAGAPEKFALVIYTGKIRELMQIPGMRDRAIRGGLNGGVEGPEIQGASSKLLVQGYGGVLDVYHSDQIVSSTGYHNMMFSVGNGAEEACLQNPWVPLQTPSGVQNQKLYVDIEWNSTRRAIEVNPTTIETWLGAGFTSTTNKFMVDIVTA